MGWICQTTFSGTLGEKDALVRQVLVALGSNAHTVAARSNDSSQWLTGLVSRRRTDIAALFTFVLQQYGAEVLLATTAGAGLGALDQKPDVLVCNIRLLDMDGQQLLRLIRSQCDQTTRHIPAIAVTSYTREVSATEVSRSGFDRFLHKPIEAEQLVLSILSLVG